jgi:hypothetical protein
MMTFDQFTATLTKSMATTIPRLEVGLDKVGELAQTLAASYPGHERSEWAPLADSTLEDKREHGWPVPSPLKRTGDMADSVEKELDASALEVVVGSREMKALWQEMGTPHIPPRPFLALGMKNTLPYAEDVFGEIAIRILSGK